MGSRWQEQKKSLEEELSFLINGEYFAKKIGLFENLLMVLLIPENIVFF